MVFLQVASYGGDLRYTVLYQVPFPTTLITPDADVTDDDMINLAKLYEAIDVVETSFDTNFTKFEKSKRLSSTYVTARLLGFQREISNCNSSLYQTDQLKVENPLVYGV